MKCPHCGRQVRLYLSPYLRLEGEDEEGKSEGERAAHRAYERGREMMEDLRKEALGVRKRAKKTNAQRQKAYRERQKAFKKARGK